MTETEVIRLIAEAKVQAKQRLSKEIDALSDRSAWGSTPDIESVYRAADRVAHASGVYDGIAVVLQAAKQDAMCGGDERRAEWLITDAVSDHRLNGTRAADAPGAEHYNLGQIKGYVQAATLLSLADTCADEPKVG